MLVVECAGGLCVLGGCGLDLVINARGLCLVMRMVHVIKAGGVGLGLGLGRRNGLGLARARWLGRIMGKTRGLVDWGGLGVTWLLRACV